MKKKIKKIEKENFEKQKLKTLNKKENFEKKWKLKTIYFEKKWKIKKK